MSDSTKLDLDALEALEKAATRGNWVVRERKFSYSIPTEHPIPALEIRTEWVHPQLKDQDHVVVPCTRSAVEEWAQHGIWVSAKDAALIVALRNAAPALIAAARRVAILERQDREAATYVECASLHSLLAKAAKGLDKLLEPWRHCPSTHCERREECSSPNECAVGKKSGFVILAEILAVKGTR